MDEAERGLHDLLLERLLDADRDDDRDGLDDAAADLVLAAWAGEEDLDAVLAGRPTPAVDREHAAPRTDRPDTYLAAVHVAGFRGVGAEATLPLRPGPGLTLVTGRNGSGKSSLAEAAEVALTGDSRRWSARSAVWREGWRNLHADGPVSVAVDLVTAGAPGTTRYERSWPVGAELDGATWTRQRTGGRRAQVTGPWCGVDMDTYRPFLSYSELGALIDGKPSELHDALFRLLGLGPLTAAQERLDRAHTQLAAAARAVGATRRELRSELGAIEDPRTAEAAALLAATHPDLDRVAALVAGVDDAGEQAVLAALAQLRVPDAAPVAAATAELGRAADAVSARAEDGARSADRVAALLRAALHHHDEQGPGPCPVCGGATLDGAWRAAATLRAAGLEDAAAELRRTSARLDAATAAARALVAPVPEVLRAAAPVDVGPARDAWERWAAAGRVEGPAELARALGQAHPPLLAAVAKLQDEVEAARTRRDEVWAPVARRLAAWHDEAARAAAQAGVTARLKAAATWLAATSGALRDQRLAPFAAASQEVWRQLRQQSDVDLGPVRLDGARTRRRVALDVRVDGTDGGTALGVMSQGELHALGLSLFLPRATADQSPFRFVLVDDPVQAMDPAKVDGLARVLAGVARTRQVVVFTHDDRLAEAVRRLELPATVWEVQRGERSGVELRRCDDPVARYLDDARAMARTEALPDDMRRELVASCCRSAVEAACHARVRAVRLGRGDSHAVVEAALAGAQTTHQKATLAVFDDPDRGGDLLATLRRAGPRAVDTFRGCKQGAHRGISGDLRTFVEDTQQLAGWLQR